MPTKSRFGFDVILGERPRRCRVRAGRRRSTVHVLPASVLFSRYGVKSRLLVVVERGIDRVRVVLRGDDAARRRFARARRGTCSIFASLSPPSSVI